jgi:hypothetical protein
MSKILRIKNVEGVHCEKCGELAEVREHKGEPKRETYYSRWYICKNRSCSRTMFAFPEDMRTKTNDRALAQQEEQDSFFLRNL